MTSTKEIWNGIFKESSQPKYPCELLVSFLAGKYFLRPKKNKIKILELGCGNGANLYMVAKEGFSAYGIDFSENAIRLCEKKLKEWQVSARLRIGDMRSLPYPDNFFDVIYDI